MFKTILHTQNNKYKLIDFTWLISLALNEMKLFSSRSLEGLIFSYFGFRDLLGQKMQLPDTVL